jgi:hypothetical protein
VYYAVAPSGDKPDPSDYTLLDTVVAGKYERQITLGAGQVGGDYNVHVVVMKGGAVSDPLVINTKKGGGEVNYEWGTGRFVTVAYNSNEAAYSDNGGETWKAATLPSVSGWYGVAYGGGVFVAVAANSNEAAYSDNGGETWKAATLPSSAKWQSVAYGGGVFVAVVQDSGTAAYSDNGGQSWKAATTLPGSGYSSVAYGDGALVSVGNNRVAYSDDGGKSWTG